MTTEIQQRPLCEWERQEEVIYTRTGHAPHSRRGTRDLIKEMEMHLPIPAYPSKEVCEIFLKQGMKINKATELMITRVVDSGDTGGIMCTIEKENAVFVISLTCLRVKVSHPLGRKIAEYQVSRIKNVLLKE